MSDPTPPAPEQTTHVAPTGWRIALIASCLVAIAGVLQITPEHFYGRDPNLSLPFAGTTPVLVFLPLGGAVVLLIHLAYHRALPHTATQPERAARWFVRWAKALQLFVWRGVWVWLGPITLALLWRASFAAMSGLLTLFLGALLIISLWSVRGNRAVLIASGSRARLVQLPVLLALSAAILITGQFRTQGGGFGYGPDKPSEWVSLFRVDLTERHTDWLPYIQARAKFKREWCWEKGLPSPCDVLPPLQETELQRDWIAARTAFIAALDKPDLSRRDLRSVDFQDAFASGITFYRSDLRGTVMHFANLESAQMSDVDLTGANLSSIDGDGMTLINSVARDLTIKVANLRFAKLAAVDFRGGNFFSTNMQFADLSSSKFDKADMQFADLTGADLTNATFIDSLLQDMDWQGALSKSIRLDGSLVASTHREKGLMPLDLRTAEMYFTAFWRMDLRGAQIRQEDLNRTFGDSSVLLPPGLTRPCHWAEHVPAYQGLRPSSDFMGRWRGWMEANLQSWPPSDAIPEGAQAQAIAPPAECLR